MASFQFLTNDLVRRISSAVDLSSGDMILLYGSAATGKTSSDFDCCVIKKDYTLKDLDNVVSAVIGFHRANGLRLDDEVPHHNKLMYSQYELFDTITRTPFSRNMDGSVCIAPIEKNLQFLSSEQIKKRLLLNLMTTHSIILAGDEERFDFYKRKAWDTLSKFMFAYHGNSSLSPGEFVENLYTDKFSKRSGEDFLGYKRERPAIAQYLRKNTMEYFARSVGCGQMEVDPSGGFYFNEKVLRDFVRLLPEKRYYSHDLYLQHQKDITR